MRFVIEAFSRFFTMESGRVIYEDMEIVSDDEPEAEETPVIHVPMGFTRIAPEEGSDDDEDEAPEVDCC